MNNPLPGTLSEKCPANVPIIWFEVLTIIIASLGTFTVGCLMMWPSPAIPILINEYPGNITLEDASYLTIIPQISSMLFNPFFSALMNKIGRKSTILLCVFPQIISWNIIAFTKSINLLYLSRVFSGMADGILFGTVSSYIGEIASPRVREVWSIAPMFLVSMGSLTINIIGGIFSIQTSAFLLMPIPVIASIALLFMPESPYYLLMKNQREKAQAALQTLRRQNDVENELINLTLDVNRQNSESGKWSELVTNRVHRKSLTIACFSRIIQLFSGVSAFSVYAQYLFSEAGSTISPMTSSTIFCIALAIVLILGSYIINILGRKLSMITSCFACAMCLILVSIYFYLKQMTLVNVSALSWFPSVGLVLFIISYGMGIGSVPIVMAGEMFSTSIKAKANAFLGIIFNISMCSSNMLFPILSSKFGLWTPFCFYAVTSTIGGLLSICLIPNNTGKTLEEIQQSFAAKKKSSQEVN